MQECANSCDRRCVSHETHGHRIAEAECELKSMGEWHMVSSNRLSSLEGRLTTFTWICGLLLSLLVVFSVYGVMAINAFKAEYYKDMALIKVEIARGVRP